MKDMELQQKHPSEAENIASEILERIKHDPALAMEIGSYLTEYAERDVAEALRLEHEKCSECTEGRMVSASGGGVACDRCTNWFCY